MSSEWDSTLKFLELNIYFHSLINFLSFLPAQKKILLNAFKSTTLEERHDLFPRYFSYSLVGECKKKNIQMRPFQILKGICWPNVDWLMICFISTDVWAEGGIRMDSFALFVDWEICRMMGPNSRRLLREAKRAATNHVIVEWLYQLRRRNLLNKTNLSFGFVLAINEFITNKIQRTRAAGLFLKPGKTRYRPTVDGYLRKWTLTLTHSKIQMIVTVKEIRTK